MRNRFLALLPTLVLGACGSSHPLAGNWSPEGPVEGMTVGLEFDGKAEQVGAHVDGPNGHSHPAATCTYDAASGVVTVKAKLLGEGKPDTWTGKPVGESLELVGGAIKLKFKKGGRAH